MMTRFWLAAIAGITMIVATNPLTAQTLKMKYPATRTDAVTDVLHGEAVADPYRWLEDANNPEVRDWVEKQNQLTRSVLDKLPGRTAIHDRLSTLLEIGTLGTPQLARGRYFYVKRDGKQNQPILYMREGLRGKDRVLVDPNQLATDGTVALDWWFPSWDGKLVAYGLSRNGSEQSTLSICESDTGKKRSDVIDRTRYCSLAWLPDNSGFYFTRYPAGGSVPAGEENYHHHVYFHALGSDPAKDTRVFGLGRPKEDMPAVQISPDGRWLVVTEQKGWAVSEVYVRDLKAPDSHFKPLVEGVPAVFEPIVRNNRLFLRTNENAPRYKLIEVDPLHSERTHWIERIPEAEDVLESVAVTNDRLVCQSLRRAASRLRICDSKGRFLQDIDLPTLGTVAGLGEEWDGKELLFAFQSFTVAPSVFRTDLETGKTELWEQVRTSLDLSGYEVTQVQFPSKDGTSISMFLAAKKSPNQMRPRPTLLYAYGGFNINLTPTFNASRFLFLEHGGMIAIPNVRGGGEYGEDWHRAGMLGNKQNVFDDFLAAAEWLIHNETDARHLVIQGGSNGGLLMGAALTQRPDLFRAVVCQVPLLDMVRYDKFLIARLWIPEYGSADDPEQFRWLCAYSPYHKVKNGTAYPAVLLEAAESDSRVDALHARKMAARLQAAGGSDQPILLRLETKAGHGMGKPRAKVLEELTDIWSFIYWQLGLQATKPRS